MTRTKNQKAGPVECARLPLIEVRHEPNQGYYLDVDGQPKARFDEREHACQCAAQWINDEIAKL